MGGRKLCSERSFESGLVSAVLTRNELVGEDLWRMSLKTPGWSGPEPLPGQFLMLRMGEGDDPLLARPFGIAGFEQEGSNYHLDILYRIVGRGTRRMSLWEEGTEAKFLGPLGNGFTLPAEGSKSVLVAGGIGIPPLLALARRLVEMGRGEELTFLYGESSSGRLVDLEHRSIPGVEMLISTEDGSSGTKGMVTDLLADRIDGITDMYVCGPNVMLRAVHRMTVDLHAVSQYSLEARMACGYGVCSGCAVMVREGKDENYVRVCVEGPVLYGDRLIDASFPEDV